MSKHFVLATEGVGPGGDIFFRHHPSDNWYSLFVGDVKFGLVIKCSITGTWMGISYAEESEFFGVRSLDGFATRMGAATFIIKHHGYWLRDERELKKDLEKWSVKYAG